MRNPLRESPGGTLASHSPSMHGNTPLGKNNGAPPEHALCAACALHPGEVVDRNGFHTAACPSAFRARKDDCHDKVRDVLADAVERVGGIGKREPATKGVLLNQIDASILRVDSPKAYSAAARMTSNQILTLIGQMNGATLRDPTSPHPY